MRKIGLAGVLGVLALGGCSFASGPCDRECLIRLADGYVAGLVSGDPSGVPLAQGILLVENLKRIHVGEGLWKTATGGPTRFAVSVPDTDWQTVGWMGMIEREGKPTLAAIRLKYENGAIVEAEHLTVDIRPEDLKRLRIPRAGLLGQVPDAYRLQHDELIRIGASYYDAVDNNDGTLAPFAVDCERHENGSFAAGPDVGPRPRKRVTEPEPSIANDCSGQLTSNVMEYIDRIDNRRVFAADPVTGLVMGLSHFRHPMDFAPYQVTMRDGSTTIYGRDQFEGGAFDLPSAHIFKVGPDGNIHEIEAMGFGAPYNSPTGWE